MCKGCLQSDLIDAQDTVLEQERKIDVLEMDLDIAQGAVVDAVRQIVELGKQRDMLQALGDQLFEAGKKVNSELARHDIDVIDNGVRRELYGAVVRWSSFTEARQQ